MASSVGLAAYLQNLTLLQCTCVGFLHIFYQRKRSLFDVNFFKLHSSSLCNSTPQAHASQWWVAVSEACHSSFPIAGDISVTFSPHCGLVGGFNVGPLPGRDEEEQAELADRWRGDPWWECATLGSPAPQLGPVCSCCWASEERVREQSWDRDEGQGWSSSWLLDWSWWISVFAMTSGLEGGIDVTLKSSGSPDVPGGSLFTWITKNKRVVGLLMSVQGLHIWVQLTVIQSFIIIVIYCTVCSY